MILLNEGEYYFNVGELQGLCLYHTVWLVVINNLFRHLAKTKVWVVRTFTNDVFVAARIPAVYMFADVLGPVFAKFHCWTTTSSMDFSYIKYLCTIAPPKSIYSNALSRTILIE